MTKKNNEAIECGHRHRRFAAFSMGENDDSIGWADESSVDGQIVVVDMT